jgi:hypothetical protein
MTSCALASSFCFEPDAWLPVVRQFGLENGRVGAHIRNMKRERYEARALGWHVVRIDRNGIESTVEVWPEEKAKHRAAVLDQRAAESFEAERKLPRKGRDD